MNRFIDKVSLRQTRRSFLRGMGSSALGAAFAPGLLSALPSGNPPAFEEIKPSASGINWHHVAGLSSDMYLPETVGAGCAFLDYDGDGWMDIYLVNSGPCDFYQPPSSLRNALYRNNRDGTFTDVTDKAGVGGTAYGMGVAVGDYDGDGYPDLYVTQYPNSILYHNNGDGTFTDVTKKAGVAALGWGTSAVWFDYDNDGRLDLFVCRFADFSRSKNIYCGNKESGRYYCKPTLYKPMTSWLFHNNGDGTFTDVSEISGITHSPSKAWGVVAVDINNDGKLDLFVANDTSPNSLFLNRGNGRFEDVGLQAGVAYSSFGVARSGMGVDAADFDQDGWIDLFVSNVDHESYSMYRNNKDETFDDIANTTGIGNATTLMSGWGAKFFDYNNDGNLDLLLCNGHPDLMIEDHLHGLKYHEPLMLFQNDLASWKNVSAQSGPIFAKDIAGRGLALGDFDNDGSVDVLVTVNNGAPLLLRNNAGRQNHWLGLHLIGQRCNIDAIGAKVIYKAGGIKRQVDKVGGGSYLSAHDPRIVLGLAQNTQIEWLEIHWPQPSRIIERFQDLPIDRYITVVEGSGSFK